MLDSGGEDPLPWSGGSRASPHRRSTTDILAKVQILQFRGRFLSFRTKNGPKHYMYLTHGVRWETVQKSESREDLGAVRKKNIKKLGSEIEKFLI